MSTEGGWPAFPYTARFEGPCTDPIKGVHVPAGSAEVHIFGGISIRDYFAAAALPLFKALIEARSSDIGGLAQESAVARSAYMLADAMLAERAK